MEKNLYNEVKKILGEPDMVWTMSVSDITYPAMLKAWRDSAKPAPVVFERDEPVDVLTQEVTLFGQRVVAVTIGPTRGWEEGEVRDPYFFMFGPSLYRTVQLAEGWIDPKMDEWA
jgi:hypothetical protein